MRPCGLEVHRVKVETLCGSEVLEHEVQQEEVGRKTIRGLKYGSCGDKALLLRGRAVIPSNVKKQTTTQGRGREEGSKSITRRDCQALREGAGYHTWARAHPTVLKRIWPW